MYVRFPLLRTCAGSGFSRMHGFRRWHPDEMSVKLNGEMLRFRRMKSLPKFASVHGSIYNHFNQERHLIDRRAFKERRSAALAEWSLLAC